VTVKVRQATVDGVEFALAAVPEFVYKSVLTAKKVAVAVGQMFPGTRVILRQDATYGIPEYFDPSGISVSDSVLQQLKTIDPRDSSVWPEHEIDV